MGEGGNGPRGAPDVCVIRLTLPDGIDMVDHNASLTRVSGNASGIGITVETRETEAGAGRRLMATHAPAGVGVKRLIYEMAGVTGCFVYGKMFFTNG